MKISYSYLDMSSLLLLTSNRTYAKFPLSIIYRHLSTIEHRSNDQLILTNGYKTLRSNSNQTNEWTTLSNKYFQKRFITLHVPPTEDPKITSNRNAKLSFEFPPGNPNDKPKLEHLRFIEGHLIQIVNLYHFVLRPSFLFSYICFCF